MGKVLFKNILALFSIQAANYIFPLITVPYVSRALGPEGFGDATLATSIVQYFSTFIDYGFNFSATQAIARNQRDKIGVSKIFWAVSACKLVLNVVAAIAFGLLIMLVPSMKEHSLLLVVAFLGTPASILFPTWFFQGMERMGGVATCNLIARTISIPIIIMLVRSPDDAWMLVFIQSLTAIGAGVISIWLVYKRSMVVWVAPSVKDIVKTFEEGRHMFITTVAISLYSNTNVVVLGLVSGNQAVGLFAAADKIRVAAQGACTPILQAVYPRVSVLMSEDKQEALRFIRRLATLVSIGTGAISALLFLLARPIVHVLLGDTFLAASGVLQWLACLPFVIALSNILAVQTMLPLGMKKEVSRVTIASGLLNLALIVPLSYFFQAEGAAASVLVTEICVTSLMGLLLARRTPGFLKLKEVG